MRVCACVYCLQHFSGLVVFISQFHKIHVFYRVANSLNKHTVMKSGKFNRYTYSKSKWITKEILKSIKYKDNLYKEMKITRLHYQVIKTNFSTYSTILKKSIE